MPGLLSERACIQTSGIFVRLDVRLPNFDTQPAKDMLSKTATEFWVRRLSIQFWDQLTWLLGQDVDRPSASL